MSLIHACNEMLYNARSDRKKGRVGCQELGLHKSHEFVVSSLKLTAKAPENGPSQKETSIPTIHFQVRTVSFRGCILQIQILQTLIFSSMFCDGFFESKHRPTDKPKKDAGIRQLHSTVFWCGSNSNHWEDILVKTHNWLLPSVK